MEHQSEPASALPSAGPREFAHRLNNLLTVVLAHAEISLASNDPEEMRKALRIIVDTACTMANLSHAFGRSDSEATTTLRPLRETEGA